MNDFVALWRILARLEDVEGERAARVFRRSDVEVFLYAPSGEDDQIPHDRDELYFVALGRGVFRSGAERRSFRPGDFLFVPAGRAHRFEKFTDDLAVWVVFFGPEGGYQGLRAPLLSDP